MSRNRRRRRTGSTHSATPTVRRSPYNQRRLWTRDEVLLTPAARMYAAVRQTPEVNKGWHDRRMWRPPQEVERTATSPGKRRADELIATYPGAVRVRDPKRVLACARRAQRKQAMFATGKAGRKGRQSSKRYNSESEIRCK